jgi:hypothetical protein
MSDGNSEAEKGEVRWPRDSDCLFLETSWAHDAQVARHPKERFYRMPTGYKRSGDLLVERAALDVVDRANVVYAALFCYRQSIELFLKQLINEYGTNTCEPKNTHNLGILWSRFMEIVKARGREGALGLIAAQRLIAEMDDADNKSDGFRFPANIAGLPFAFGDRGIDLANLRDVMDGLENLFECAYLDFSHQDDMQADSK